MANGEPAVCKTMKKLWIIPTLHAYQEEECKICKHAPYGVWSKLAQDVNGLVSDVDFIAEEILPHQMKLLHSIAITYNKPWIPIEIDWAYRKQVDLPWNLYFMDPIECLDFREWIWYVRIMRAFDETKGSKGLLVCGALHGISIATKFMNCGTDVEVLNPRIEEPVCEFCKNKL
jgi:hypothetical protein